MAEELRRCRRCLLRDLDTGNILEDIRRAVAHTPKNRLASPEAVQSRLEVCQACDHLMSGTCLLCGCYVEFRATQKTARCPAVPAKWKPE